MRVLTPATQPTAVTTAGVITPITIPANLRGWTIGRIVVNRRSGTGANVAAVLSTHSLCTDEAHRIAQFSAEPVIDYAGKYLWRGLGTIYVKTTPDAGNDNAIEIYLYMTPPEGA